MTASRPTNIDYVSMYFQIVECTKIHGEPIFETLKVPKNQIKANAGSVSTHLGGGALGYLGLLLSPAKYAPVAPGTPFVRPPNPGVLVIPPGTAQHAATRLREDHKEALRVFRECIDIEEALKKQVLVAIKEKWQKCLRNRLTQRVNLTLEALFQTLFQRYGFVTQQRLGEFEKEVQNYQYNVRDPLSMVFDLVDDLKLMAEAVHTPFTERQLVSFALEILWATNDFQEGIKSWNCCAAAVWTWPNFITYFEQEYQKLLELCRPSCKIRIYSQPMSSLRK